MILRRSISVCLALVLALSILLVGGMVQASPPPYDPLHSWNEKALATVRAKNASDAQAARLYAMVNVAVFDAVNGIVAADKQDGARQHALVSSETAPRHANLYAAASSAAHGVLTGEYPDLAATMYNPLLATELAALESGERTDDGIAWGAFVAQQVRSQRSADGTQTNESQPGGSGPGIFRTSWSGVQFRNMTPFAISDPSEYYGVGPASLGSLDYAGAYANVKIIGNKDIADQSKVDTFRFWSLGGSTSQPPGAWVQVAMEVTEVEPPSLQDEARLFALVTMAMADTVGPTYMTKFIHRHWRPGTAIREGDSDGNTLTAGDPAWNHRSGGSVGSSPEYWSGHSSFSASAAEALAGFFGTDNVAFTFVSDSAPIDPITLQPISRTYSSFSQAAAEAGRSREVGGIHFSFSNLDGLTAGRAIAKEILGNKMLPLN